MIVVDTNIVSYLWLDTKRSRRTDELHNADPFWTVPRLWRYEFMNVLAVHVHKGMVPLESALSVWREASSAFQSCEYETDSQQVLRIAAENKVSAYDAEFITLAVQLGVRLVTEDRELLQKFPEIAASIELFLQKTPKISERTATYRAGRIKRT